MKKILFVLTWFAVLLLGSCVNEKWDGDGNVVPNETANNTLILKVGQDQSELATRTPVDPVNKEDKISTLHLLFFEPKADRGGVFVDYVEVEGVRTNPGASQWTIDLVGSQVSVSDAYHILAVANVGSSGSDLYLNGDDVDSWMRQWNGKTEKEVMTGAFAWAKKGVAVGSDLLLMNGRIEKEANQYTVSVELVRNQARFDVHNSVFKEYDLVSVAIYNAYPISSIWNEGKVDYSEDVARIYDYYTIDNTTNMSATGDVNGSYLNNITGDRLYTFENQVPKSVQNDKFTTSLILGMKDRAKKTTTYYRANIVPPTGTQMLKRNNVYRLTVENIGGPGALTADEAYRQADNNNLDYEINYWSVGEENTVLAHDGNSILSVPTKTIRISGKGTDATGLAYSIFTFTNSVNPTLPLEIKSQTFEPADGQIRVNLSDKKFTVHANPLPSSLIERRGEVVFSYAGLKVSVNIIQTDVVDDNLQVHLPDGGIPNFAPFGGLSSGLLRVEASGPWTAIIHGAGFSFSKNEFKNEIKSTINSGTDFNSALIVDNRFHVWTHSANSAEAYRTAFVVVSLDKDDVNYAQVIHLQQDGAGQISLLPAQESVTFDGMGSLANVVNNSKQEFEIRTTQISDAPITYADWEYAFGKYNERKEFVPDSNPATNQFFRLVNLRHNTTDPEGEGFGFKVEAIDKNTSGKMCNAILRINMKNTAKCVYLQLLQQSAGISFSPSIIPAVAKAGGESQLITIDADESLKWQATITTNGTAGTRSLKHHEAWLVDGSGNKINPGDVINMATQKQFRVVFPKIYYPNREIPVSATVKVSIEGSELKKEITVNQTTLTPDRFKGYGITGSPAYAHLDNGPYHMAWNWAIQNISGYSTYMPAGNYYTPSIPAARPEAINYLHIVPHFYNGHGYNWQPYYDMLERDGWTVIIGQDNAALPSMNNSKSPLKQGSVYNNLVYDANGGARISNTHQNTKVFQFLTAQGAYQKVTPSSIENFYSDGISCYIPGSWPSSAVVLTVNNNHSDRAMMIIDIKNRFFWSGESQQFDGGIFTSVAGPNAGNPLPGAHGRTAFLRNLSYFLANAARYGSHFTDLFLEEGVEGAQKAPWDTTYWGENAGVPSSAPGRP